jgi:hypothetical protein
MSSSIVAAVKKVFEINLRDGRKFQLTQEDAEELRDILNAELPKRVSLDKYMQKLPESNIADLEDMPHKPIPPTYKFIGKVSSQPRNGGDANIYCYYEDEKGNFAYLILDKRRMYPFSKLGNINDPKSAYGRLLRKIPTDSFISKTTIQHQKLFANTQTLKAILDIAETKGHIERPSSLTGKKKSEYRRLVLVDDPA